MAAKLIKNKGTDDGFCCPNARFQLKKGASFLPFAALRIHLSVAARIHPSRKYIFPLSRGCIHQENVFFPLSQGCIHRENIFFCCRRGAYIKKIYFSVAAGVHTSRKYIFPLSQRCIHRENIFFRCRRGAYIKKIYFLALKYLSPRARMAHFHGIIPFWNAIFSPRKQNNMLIVCPSHKNLLLLRCF